MENNRFIKILSALLVAILIVSIAPMNDAVVAEMKSSANGVVKSIGEVVENLDFTLPEITPKAEAVTNFYQYVTWDSKTKTMTIHGEGEMPAFTTSPWKEYNFVESLVVEGSFTNIGENAFLDFTNLKKIVIIAPVTSLNKYAFRNCTALEEIVLPESLLHINSYVFENCTSLEQIQIPDSLQSIGSYAFLNCTALKEIELGNGFEKLYSKAFYNCSALKKITIDDNAKYIALGAFEGTRVEELVLPFTGGGPNNTSNLKTDQLAYAFGDVEVENSYSVKSTADSKKYFYIPDSLKRVTITQKLYKYGLRETKSLEEVVIAETVSNTSIPACYVQDCVNLKSVKIESSKINTIGMYAFSNCTSLGDFVLPQSIDKIMSYSFNNCTNLSNIEFPERDFVVEYESFKNAKFITDCTDEFLIVGDGVLIRYNGTDTNVVIPEGVKRVCRVFENRSDILSIQLPDGLKYITSDSFYGCLGITELVVPDSVIAIEEEAFDGMCKLEKLTVPFIGKSRNVKTDTEEALIGYWFRAYTTNKVCETCRSENCIRRTQSYNSSKYTRTFYQPKKLQTLTVTDGILRSKSLAKFYIADMTVGKNVDGIEAYGLYNSGIKNLHLDPMWDIEELPDFAFATNSIEEIVLPTSIKKLGAAFVGNPITSITLHEGIEEINGTFKSTKLTSIDIPDTVTKILGSAFEKCSQLTEINIGKNVQEISTSAFLNTNIVAFNVDEENEYYFDENGILYSKDGVLSAYPSGNASDTYYISAKVTNIPDRWLDQFDNIARFVVDEDNEYYHSCDGVLYTSDGSFMKYPDKKADSVFVIDSKVKRFPKYNNEWGEQYDTEWISNIKAVEVAEDNPWFTSIDGVLYDKEITIIRWYPQKRVGDYTAPDTVNTVGYRSFYMAKVGKLEFPNDVRFDVECFYQAEMEELIAVNFRSALCIAFGYSYMHSQPYNPDNLKRLVLTNQTSNLPGDFANNFTFNEIEINGTFTSIGDCAFRSVRGCKEIILPDTVEFIGDSAFEYADFRKVYLGTSLKTISTDAFSLSEIKSVDLPDSVEYIGDSAFYYSALTKLNMGKNVTHIGEYAFSRTEFTEIKLPETLEYIGDGAFTETKITEINLGNKITHIGYRAFGSSMLKKAVISENLADMSDKIFLDCKYLETVVVGGAVESIGEEAFGNCTALEAVIIPDNVTEISDDAFLDANEDLVIYCNEGSYAQSYATKNNIKYTTLVIDPIENQTYTGKEIKPEVNASADSRRLTQDSEYTVTYKDNINVGSAKVIAKGLGDFKHLAATAKFTILPKSAEEVTVLSTGSVYNPNGVTPKIYVCSGSNLLVEGRDYELLDNPVLTDAGEYSIAVSLIGNYDGVINATYKIAKKSIAKTDIEYGNTVKITYKGVALEEGKDYTVEKETKENGDIVTTVKGVGNYTGTDSYTQKVNNQQSLNWFENLINAIRRLFESLFNMTI